MVPFHVECIFVSLDPRAEARAGGARMGAYKRNMVVVIKMGAYIHGCLFCMGAYYPGCSNTHPNWAGR